MRWLRKAILRAAGVIPLHDEELAFATGTTALREQAHHGTRLDWLAVPIAAGVVLLVGCLGVLLGNVTWETELYSRRTSIRGTLARVQWIDRVLAE